MKTKSKSPLAAAMGVAIISSLNVATASAEANPFGMSELTNGYMQVAEAAKTGEMACGANMPGMKDSKSNVEGACAGSKTSSTAKTSEGKCGEGKCGAMMDGDKMKKGMESTCGAMMKGKEGACGNTKAAEGKCGSQCGEQMKNCANAKSAEGACGAQMKGCGEGMQGCAEMMKGKEGGCAADKKPASATPGVSVKPATPAKP